jgi:hypothetical protein
MLRCRARDSSLRHSLLALIWSVVLVAVACACGGGSPATKVTAETWTGTMSLAGFTKDPVGTVCTDPGTNFTISFTAAPWPDVRVQGEGQHHGPGYTCVSQEFGSVTSAPDMGTFAITGLAVREQADRGEFSLHLEGPVSGSRNFDAFWPGNQLGKWTVPFQGAQAHAVITGIAGGTLPGKVTLTVDLTCSGCTTGSS